MIDFSGLSAGANGLFFALAAALVWIGGTRLARCTDAIASRTGLSRVFLGALLLGGATSLPEAATVLSAAALQNAALAVSNLVGGVALQVTVLAVVDGVAPGRPLSRRVEQPAVLMQGMLQVIVLVVVAAGITVGEISIGGVGLWAALVGATAVGAFYLSRRMSQHETWLPAHEEFTEQREPAENPAQHDSRSRLVTTTCLSAMLVLVGGILLAQTADALAAQTHLGSGFLGAVLLATATSLPEVTTTWKSIRLGQPAMGFSNIFGTNILDLSFILLAEFAFTGAPILSGVSNSTLFVALLGIAVTMLYLIGILSRPRRLVLGMGFDSLAMLLVYSAGVLLIHLLR